MHTHAEKSSENKSKAQRSDTRLPDEEGVELMDLRAEAVAQRKLQHIADNSPQVLQQKALAASIHTTLQRKYGEEEETEIAEPIAVPENKTGLPLQLKAGLEALSGMTMDDVRVHYGSQKPAQLKALAFAQGTDIHVAPGQEKHLPHEAWHVVQQKQGRVQPTLQLKTGVAINDNQGLEKEADVMGARALQLQATGEPLQTVPVPDKKVAQRTIEWKDDNHPDDVLDAFADALNTVVQTGADTALTEVDSLTGDDGYTLLWKDTALLLIAKRDDDLAEGDVGEANVATRFSYARYGYAVESYANDQRETLQAALPAGYTFAIQAGRGMTRPDFIVFDDTEDEVGWFDITSEGSLGHIDRKTGAGWRARTYVAEITYPALESDNLSMGNAGIGVRVRARNAARRRRENWAAFIDDKKTQFGLRYNLFTHSGDPKSVKRDNAKTALHFTFPNHNITDGVAKSLLRAFGLLPVQYGFPAAGGSKADGENIIRQYEDDAGA